MYQDKHNDYEQIKDAVQKAYRSLRKKGYFCRSNFWCCQGCGWAAIDSDNAAEKAVFWHKQDTEHAGRTGRLMLAWDGDGEEIVAELKKQGLGVKWDGSKNKRIEVFLPKNEEPKEPVFDFNDEASVIATLRFKIDLHDGVKLEAEFVDRDAWESASRIVKLGQFPGDYWSVTDLYNSMWRVYENGSIQKMFSS